MTEGKDKPGDVSEGETELIGGIEQRAIVVVPYRQDWPETYRHHAERIAAALGDVALRIEHIGSTAVPGLAAKPIVDMLVVVADSAHEDAYLPAMQRAGYELRVREPDFEEHRMLRTAERDVHVHVLSAGSPEVERYLRFRDALRATPFLRALPGAQAGPRGAGLGRHERLRPGQVRDGRGDHPVVGANASLGSEVCARRRSIRSVRRLLPKWRMRASVCASVRARCESRRPRPAKRAA